MVRIIHLKQIILYLLCFLSQKAHAQATDIIYKKDSSQIHILIVKTEKDSITYRLYGQPKGDVFSIATSEVNKIVLKNGYIEYFSETAIKRSKNYVYLDMSFGGKWVAGGTYGMSQIGVGYILNPQLAIGISRRAMSEYTRVSGWGLEGRFTPNQVPFLIKLEFGFFNKASLIDESGPLIYTFLPNRSKNMYTTFMALIRFGRIFTFGLGICSTNNFQFKVTKSNDPTYNSILNENISYATWQLGIALPSFKKGQFKKQKNSK